jgi:hypothetical protein
MNNAGTGSGAEVVGKFKATQASVQTVVGNDTLNDGIDAGMVIDCNSGSGQIITLPEAPAIGTTYLIIQRGAGQVTIAKTGSDAINGSASVQIQNQYGAATLIYVASHVYAAVGDL